MEQVKITILCDKGHVADSLREIANAVEENENEPTHYETEHVDAEFDWEI